MTERVRVRQMLHTLLSLVGLLLDGLMKLVCSINPPRVHAQKRVLPQAVLWVAFCSPDAQCEFLDFEFVPLNPDFGGVELWDVNDFFCVLQGFLAGLVRRPTTSVGTV